MGDFESLITKEPVEENSGDGSLSLSVGAHWGTWGGGVRFLRILRDIWRALEREHLSLWELLREPGGGPLLWGSRRIWGGGLRGQT